MAVPKLNGCLDEVNGVVLRVPVCLVMAGAQPVRQLFPVRAE